MWTFFEFNNTPVITNIEKIRNEIDAEIDLLEFETYRLFRAFEGQINPDKVLPLVCVKNLNKK